MHHSIAEFRPRDRCPLCNASELADFLILDGLRIARCTLCDFMFSRDVLAPEAIDQFYVDGYNDQRHMDGQRVNASINVELLRSLQIDVAEKSLLDVGSGYGFFLDKLRWSKAARLAGVELSSAQRSYSDRVLRLQTFGQLEQLTGQDQFDIITAFEVIEHIPEPLQFIRAVCGHLKPGGSLVIGTDNFTSNVVTVMSESFPKWIPHEHVSFFSPGPLKTMLLRCNGLTFNAARSFTPWELLLQKLAFQATSGRKGGKSYCYQAERDVHSQAGYRLFQLRHAANRSWFKLTQRPDLNGEMMYIHMVKA
jgi:2-polyprenyl-3-methyl-5-hydroxy-6-metoxy-1,4-benzoquinol methylase